MHFTIMIFVNLILCYTLQINPIADHVFMNTIFEVIGMALRNLTLLPTAK